MANPKLYRIDEVPLERMMPADKVWVPEILAGKKIIGKAKYSPKQEKLIGEVEIKFVDSFPEE